jgi:dihydropteroate synthase
VRKIVEINEICSKLKNNLTFSVAKEEGKGPVITMHTSGVKHEIIT